jgi:hypothetical protein
MAHHGGVQRREAEPVGGEFGKDAAEERVRVEEERGRGQDEAGAGELGLQHGLVQHEPAVGREHDGDGAVGAVRGEKAQEFAGNDPEGAGARRAQALGRDLRVAGRRRPEVRELRIDA